MRLSVAPRVCRGCRRHCRSGVGAARKFIPKMALLESQIQGDQTAAIPVFRKIHRTAITINLVQLVSIVGSLGIFLKHMRVRRA